MNEAPTRPIICFGEILWDSLPRGLFPGGAPMNVAYHLKRLGAEPLPITSVGNDQLGRELMSRLQSWGVNTSGISIHPKKPTGLARVSFENGSPQFKIVEDVAWDWLEISRDSLAQAFLCDALVFGTLAMRAKNNYRQLSNLLAVCPTALGILDVNLRPPYSSAEQVWQLAQNSHLIKLNDHELGQLLHEPVDANNLADAVRRFATRARVSKVCLTAGANGAGLLIDGEWHWEPAQPVTVSDTVGAGDAFLAALLFGLLQKSHSPAEILRRACRLAEFVVTQDGATPNYAVDLHGNVVGK